MTQPEGVCRNCFVTWTASRPKPAVLFCWHSSTVARPGPAGWEITPNVGRQTLERLRKDGEL